MQGETRSET